MPHGRSNYFTYVQVCQLANDQQKVPNGRSNYLTYVQACQLANVQHTSRTSEIVITHAHQFGPKRCEKSTTGSQSCDSGVLAGIPGSSEGPACEDFGTDCVSLRCLQPCLLRIFCGKMCFWYFNALLQQNCKFSSSWRPSGSYEGPVK